MRECPKCGLRYADTIKYCSQDGAATVEVARAASDGRVVDGRYELLERMSGSATSPIYRARDLNTNSEVAVRILPSEFFPDEASRARLRKNMEVVANLHHPNLVTVYNIVEALDSVAPVYIIMELVRGESLRAMLKQSGRLHVGRAMRLMLDICAGVGSAHSHSLAHGNLKPENILITTLPDETETAKVLNLGIAMAQRDDSDARKQIIGTPLYISPEIWRGESLDARSDVYSLGIIFYEMLAGAPPFSAQEIATLLKMHLNEKPPPLPQTLSINREIEAAIMRSLSKNPDERQQDANALARDLQAAEASYRSSPRAVSKETTSELLAGSSGSTMFTGTPTVAMGEPPTTKLMPGVKQEEEAAPRAAVTESKPIYMDENVQFTVYRPRTIPPQKWYPLLAFAHLSERPPDASPDELDPIEQVEDEAKRILGDQIKNYSDIAADGSQAIPREGVITFVPVADGIEFNPPSRSFIWQESVHREEFRLRASPAVDGQTIRGRLSVFLGSILIADINLSIRVDSSHVCQTQLAESATAQPYRKIFPSYSHMDRSIVEQIEHYAEISGDKYMRDIRELRSGQDWRRWMKDAIRDADIFQLFWSRNSMRSENVREEWEYALSLERQHFIRPTYWETPLPRSPEEGLPPEALLNLHFQPLVVQPPVSAEEDSRVTLQKIGVSEDKEPAERQSREATGRTAFEAPTLAFEERERPKITDEEARRIEEAKAERQRREAEEREREEEEAKRRLEAEAQRKREEEEARLRAEEEARLRAEEEARRAAELEAQRRAEEEERQRAEEERQRLKEEASTRIFAESRRNAASREESSIRDALLETRQFPQEVVPTLREQQQMTGELEPASLGGARYDVPMQEPLSSSRDTVQTAHENISMSSPTYGSPAQNSTKSIVPILILLSLIAFILLLLLIIGGYIVYRLS